MYGYIYKTTNLINGKIYIGQKKSKLFLEDKYLGSGKYLKRAVNKYGKENFIVEILDTAESRDKLSELEIFYIEKYTATDKSVGYNIAKGGIGGGEVYVNNGYINEFITKDKLNYYLNSGWQLGMLPGRKEVNHSATRSINISKALSGRKKTLEHIKNHSDSLRRKKYHWYTTGIINDNICLSEDEEVPNGYYRGRTFSDEFKKSCGLKNKKKQPWNKGLTKETDERVLKYAKTLKNNIS